MSRRCVKPKTPLKEPFQLGQPDLDFGLYRVGVGSRIAPSQVSISVFVRTLGKPGHPPPPLSV